MKITEAINITDKKDYVRANNDSKLITDYKDMPVNMTGLIFAEVENKEGEAVRSAIIKTDKGEFIGTISPTMIDSLEVIAEVYKDEVSNGNATLEVLVKTGKSKAGREYYYATI